MDENKTAVITVSASNPEGETLIFSLTGTDASEFSISSSGVITFNTAPDYETKSAYSIVVNVSDGVNTVTKALAVYINDLANE